MRAGGRLEGRTAIVTGAGRGLGRGIALALSGEGARVACIGRTASTIQGTARMIEGRGTFACAICCDVTSRPMSSPPLPRSPTCLEP
jgi:NAD(P)-dependent dehydrogenase (short-subunit alcohol dehydrogenase family)